jgi:hypothetical protein
MRPTRKPKTREYGGVGHRREVVLVDVEAAGRRPLVEDADDFEALAADPDHLSERVGASRLEQQFVGGVTQNARVAPVLDVDAVQVSAHQHRQPRTDRKILAGPEDDQILGLQVAVEDPTIRRRTGARAELDVHVLQRAVLRLERAGVADVEVRPLHQLAELDLVGEAGHAELLEVDDVRPALRDQVAQRLVEAANQRGHADNRRDPDDHAQHRQERSHLVGAHRVEGHDDDFDEQPCPERHYSRLSASIGSRRAARIAG